ncbi:hypothetical protein [Pontibacillus chungwhensis]|nr:hypothetical protein [Pontibacillus chungwhensis]
MFQRYEKMKIVAGIILSCTLPVAYLLSMISGLEFAKILGVLVTVVMILEVMAYMVVPMIKNR